MAKQPSELAKAIATSGAWARREHDKRELGAHLDAIRAIVVELGRTSDRAYQAATHAGEDAEKMRVQLADVFRLLDSVVCPFCTTEQHRPNTHAPKCAMEEVRRCRY